MEYYTNSCGERAFVLSPKYGLGWFTQNGDKYPDCATDPGLIQLVLDYNAILQDPTLTYVERNEGSRMRADVKESIAKIAEYANEKWPDGAWAAFGLMIVWVPPNTLVKYSVFDGSEDFVNESLDYHDYLIIN